MDIREWADLYGEERVSAREFEAREAEERESEKRPPHLETIGRAGIDFDFATLEQMRTAMSIPPVIAGALMPDAHLGYALPIGGVIALEGAVSPSFVGFDIGCSVHLTIFDGAMDLLLDLPAAADVLQRVTRFGVGAHFDEPHHDPVLDDPLWEIEPMRSLRGTALSQLGSSGAGNHFADIVFGEYRPGEEFVGLMTHSGSRGTGHKVASYFIDLAEKMNKLRGIPKGCEYLDLNSEPGNHYMVSMRLMDRYATACHKIIHNSFLKAMGIKAKSHIGQAHNLAWETLDGVVLHRKGATCAEYGVLGVIPGSCGSAAYIVQGLGDNRALQSASHGAGRVASRSAAKRAFNPALFEEQMKGILHFGVAPDENPEAYKDIHRVVSQQVGLLVSIVGMMSPIVVVMGHGRPNPKSAPNE